jgi:hypothetical protein
LAVSFTLRHERLDDNRGGWVVVVGCRPDARTWLRTKDGGQQQGGRRAGSRKHKPDR